VSFAEYQLFYRALSQKRPILLRSLLLEATPQSGQFFKVRVTDTAPCSQELGAVAPYTHDQPRERVGQEYLAATFSGIMCVTVCCGVLQSVAVCCSESPQECLAAPLSSVMYSVLCCSVLQSVAECYRVLQSVGECWRVLQCTAV